MRSALYYAGAQSTATLQPFFSLQLDIQVQLFLGLSVGFSPDSQLFLRSKVVALLWW